MVMLGRRILPNYPGQETLNTRRNPEALATICRLPGLVFEARILQGSSLDGKRIAESQLGHFFNVNIIGLRRGSQIMLVSEAGDYVRIGFCFTAIVFLLAMALVPLF